MNLLLERILYILLVIVLFGVLIAVHEFGHFFTAKLLKVKVNEFAIGMGPVLWARTKGETQYSLRALPIGGFCAMEGEDQETGDPRAFSGQAAWKRIVILVAGSFMNFLMGLVIVLVLYAGITTVRVPVITELADGFQCGGASGLMVGDQILSVDGHGIWMYDNVITYLGRNDGQGMDLEVLRNGEKVTLEDLPMERFDYQYQGQDNYGFGLVFGQTEELSLWGRIKLGAVQAVDFVRTVWISLGDLVTGRVSVNQMSGVIGIVDVVSEVGTQSGSVAAGIQNVFYFMSLIAVNLAVMNLLPIPALDGGRIFFILLNGATYLVSRRRIPQRYEGYVHAGAFVLLLGLMLLVAFNDVWRIIS